MPLLGFPEHPFVIPAIGIVPHLSSDNKRLAYTLIYSKHPIRIENSCSPDIFSDPFVFKLGLYLFLDPNYP